MEAVVTVPGRTSLKFADARMTVVDNARYEPEQILLMTSSSPVAERRHLRRHHRASCCRSVTRGSPKEDAAPIEWYDEEEIGADILAKAEAVNIAYVPSDEGGNTHTASSFSRRSAAICT